MATKPGSPLPPVEEGVTRAGVLLKRQQQHVHAVRVGHQEVEAGIEVGEERPHIAARHIDIKDASRTITRLSQVNLVQLRAIAPSRNQGQSTLTALIHDARQLPHAHRSK